MSSYISDVTHSPWHQPDPSMFSPTSPFYPMTNSRCFLPNKQCSRRNPLIWPNSLRRQAMHASRSTNPIHCLAKCSMDLYCPMATEHFCPKTLANWIVPNRRLHIRHQLVSVVVLRAPLHQPPDIIRSIRLWAIARNPATRLAHRICCHPVDMRR